MCGGTKKTVKATCNDVLFGGWDKYLGFLLFAQYSNLRILQNQSFFDLLFRTANTISGKKLMEIQFLNKYCACNYIETCGIFF